MTCISLRQLWSSRTGQGSVHERAWTFSGRQGLQPLRLLSFALFLETFQSTTPSTAMIDGMTWGAQRDQTQFIEAFEKLAFQASRRVFFEPNHLLAMLDDELLKHLVLGRPIKKATEQMCLPMCCFTTLWPSDFSEVNNPRTRTYKISTGLARMLWRV